jgi:plastocyanin
MVAVFVVIAAALMFLRSDGATASRAGAVTESAPGAQISIRGGVYVPAHIEVSPGTTVVWTNEDSGPHTVTSSTQSWGSGSLIPGGTYRHRFDEPGTYPYFCVPHPNMTGVVVVRG